MNNISLEYKEEIYLLSDLEEILTEKSFNKIKQIGYLEECGFDGHDAYIKLKNLFTLEDIKNKMRELEKEKNNG